MRLLYYYKLGNVDVFKRWSVSSKLGSTEWQTKRQQQQPTRFHLRNAGLSVAAALVEVVQLIELCCSNDRLPSLWRE